MQCVTADVSFIEAEYKWPNFVDILGCCFQTEQLEEEQKKRTEESSTLTSQLEAKTKESKLELIFKFQFHKEQTVLCILAV
jgi:hypothetical protein